MCDKSEQAGARLDGVDVDFSLVREVDEHVLRLHGFGAALLAPED